MSLYRNFLSVGGWTVGSRVLGFVRDALVAAVLGTGFAADAYVAAFRFPNLFRRLFAEGAFNTAFIPLFAKSLEQEGMEQAREWASRIISWLIVVVTAVTILVEIFMPWILPIFVPGFLSDPAKFDLTVLLTRICFPYLMCMSLMAAYSAVLNGLGHFVASSFAPILLNIVMIAFMLPLVIWRNTDIQTAIWIAIGTIAGGIAQLAMVYFAVRRANFVPRLHWPKFDAEVRRFWVLAVPAVLTGGITQINIFVGTIIASGAPSAIAYLYYADRLYQLPLGTIGIAIGVTSYSSAVFAFAPAIAKAFYEAVAAGDRARQDDFLKTFYFPCSVLRRRRAGNAVSIVKAGLKVTGRPAGPVRPPLLDLSEADCAELGRLIEAGTALAESRKAA